LCGKKSNSIPFFFPEIEKDDTTVHGGSDVGWQGDVHCRLCGQVEAADHMFFFHVAWHVLSENS
jgi:hypothetical protein